MNHGATATAVAGVVLCKETCLGAAASATSLRELSRQLISFQLSQSVACPANVASKKQTVEIRLYIDCCVQMPHWSRQA